MAEELRIESAEDLERWLKDKPVEWSRVIALRAALRVVPVAIRPLQLQLEAKGTDCLALMVFRAILMSSAGAKYGAAANEPADAYAAAHAAYATYAAANAAYCEANAAYANAVYEASSAAYAAYAAYAASAASAGIYVDVKANANTATMYWRTADDARKFEWQGARGVLNAPLWSPDIAPVPPGIADAWAAFTKSPFAKEGGFAPWIAWYEAMAPFDPATPPHDPFGRDLTLKIASQDNDWWDRPAAVNADIARWWEEAKKTRETPGMEQGPAAFLFGPAPSGRLQARPLPADASDNDFAQAYLEETRTAVREMLAELALNHNYDPHIPKVIERFLGALGTPGTAVNPAMLRFHAVRVESLFRQYGNPQTTELPDRLCDMLSGLAQHARDLQAMYPSIRALNEAAMRLNISEIGADRVRPLLDAIDDAVRTPAVADALDDSVPDALDRMKALEEQAGDDPKAREDALAQRALVHRNLATEIAEEGRSPWRNLPGDMLDDAAGVTRRVAKAAYVGALAALANAIAGPVGALATVLAGYDKIDEALRIAMKRLDELSKRLVNARDRSDKPAPSDDAGPTD